MVWLSRVSQRRGYSGILFDGSISVSLGQRVRSSFIGSPNLKEPPATVRPILFCTQVVYGEWNFEIVRTIRIYGVVRAHGSVSRHSRATAANARGNCYDLRARCGKGCAECCDRVYHTDGLAGTDGIFVFR